MLGRHVVPAINSVSCYGTGYGIGVAEPEWVLLQRHHSSREGLGLDVRLVSLS